MTHDEHHWPFHHHHKHHPATPTPVVPILNESEPTMADFTDVSVALTDPATLALSGQATVTSEVAVHVSSVVTTDDGSSETLETDGTRSHTGPVATKLASVTDDQGGSWTVSEDGQSAHLA